MNNNKITPRLSDIDSAMNQRNIPNASTVFGSDSQTIIKAPVPRRQRSIVANIPDDAIISHNDGTLTIGRFVMSGIGLEVPENIELAEWEPVFTTLFKVRDHISLWLADALAAYDRMPYGSVDEIAAYYGYEKSSVWNLKSIGTSVEYSRRREVSAAVLRDYPDAKLLSISHIDAIKSLDHEDQHEFMQRAMIEGWTVAKMREAVRTFRQSDVEYPPIAVKKRQHILGQMKDTLKLDMPLTEHMEYIAMYERQIEAHKKIIKQLRHDST